MLCCHVVLYLGKKKIKIKHKCTKKRPEKPKVPIPVGFGPQQRSYRLPGSHRALRARVWEGAMELTALKLGAKE